MPLGSITSRLSTLNPFAKAPAKPAGSTTGSTTCRPESRPNGGKGQGGTPPKDMHDAQPDDPTKRKMTLGDKVSQGANLVGAAATIYPMLKGDPKPPKPPVDGAGLKGEDWVDYQKAKMQVSVGMPQINL